VVYENAFNDNGVQADVVYTIGKGSFEQDIVFRSRLNPADYGFPTNTTRIQIFTEFYDAPQPDRIVRPIRVEGDQNVRSRMASPDLVDEILGFGELAIATGQARFANVEFASGEAAGSHAFRTSGQIDAVLHDLPSFQPPFHPYRFVFLDGCETAKGDWASVFGISYATALPRLSIQLTNGYRFSCDMEKGRVEGFDDGKPFFSGWPVHLRNYVGKWKMNEKQAIVLIQRATKELGYNMDELFKLEPEIEKPNIRGGLVVPRFHFIWKRVVGAQLEKGVFAEVDADGRRLAAFSVADY
jgi:hypothetical protein